MARTTRRKKKTTTTRRTARVAGPRTTFRTRRTCYRVDPRTRERPGVVGPSVLPHGVTLRMTTLADGRARWTYSEVFRLDQFRSRREAATCVANTVAAMRASLAMRGLRFHARGLRMTITATTSREDFADAMAGEFLNWNGRLSRATLGQIFHVAARMVAAGWRP